MSTSDKMITKSREPVTAIGGNTSQDFSRAVCGLSLYLSARLAEATSPLGGVLSSAASYYHKLLVVTNTPNASSNDAMSRSRVLADHLAKAFTRWTSNQTHPLIKIYMERATRAKNSNIEHSTRVIDWNLVNGHEDAEILSPHVSTLGVSSSKKVTVDSFSLSDICNFELRAVRF
jgi:hypothetical protein